MKRKTFSQLTKEEQKKAFDKNTELLYNECFKEDRDKETEENLKAIEEFVEKWDLEEMSLFYEKDNYNRITFYANEASYAIRSVWKVSKTSGVPFFFKKDWKTVEIFEHATQIRLTLELDIEGNEIVAYRDKDFVLSRFLEKKDFQERIEALENSRDNEVVKMLRKLRLLDTFSKEKSIQKAEMLDDATRFFLKSDEFDFSWMTKFERSINLDFSKMREKIQQKEEYLSSDQFLLDQLIKTEDVEFDENLKIFRRLTIKNTFV